jgi:hypothetical protein
MCERTKTVNAKADQQQEEKETSEEETEKIRQKRDEKRG